MPYIKADDGRREALRNGEPALTAGELNYQIFYYIKHAQELTEGICVSRIQTYVNAFLGDNPNYQRWNDMTGVLVRCYKEIERRLHFDLKTTFIQIMETYDDEIARYEDKKCQKNGDVE